MKRNSPGIMTAACAAVCMTALMAAEQRQQASPCAAALTEGVVCVAVNQYALALMHRDHLTGIVVVQDVRTGNLVAFAASDASKLDVNTSVLPLSTVKLMLAASWWDHAQPDPPSPGEKSVMEMIVTGDDNAGRRIASLLRKTIGTKAVLNDLDRYGFPVQATARQNATNFWAELPPQWKRRLTPEATYHSLDDSTPSKAWEDTLSLGEERFTVTALNLSRFLQAVGNDGVMVPPRAREKHNDDAKSKPSADGVRIMEQSTARKLQAAMRGVVERGTAKTAAEVLDGTGWQIGGKTGTGPGPNPPGPESDGWFAGLIFDPEGVAHFTVTTFVRRGGLGGGHAARISAGVARFVSGVGNTNASQNEPDYRRRFAELERSSGGQIGIAAIGGNENKQLMYRADDRFPMCSTFKLLAVAAVLKRVDEGKDTLDRMVRYGESDLAPNSPVTSSHVKEGTMRLGDLCAAAIQQSDNTAANLILQTIGGPAAVTQFARSLGDSVTQLDRTETQMNNAVPGDQHDATTPAAMCRDLQQLLAGTILNSGSRDQLEDWLRHSVTGATLIRSTVPADWSVGDKTGRNAGGSVNDVAIVRPPNGAPLFLSIYTFVPNYSGEQRDKLVAEIARIAISEVGER